MSYIVLPDGTIINLSIEQAEQVIPQRAGILLCLQ